MKRDGVERTTTLEVRRDGMLVSTMTSDHVGPALVPASRAFKPASPRRYLEGTRSISWPHRWPFAAPLVMAAGRAQ